MNTNLNLIIAESSKVSPKLDFESTDKVATDDMSPKIHGVRVIVDTSNVKKSIGTSNTFYVFLNSYIISN